MSVFRRPWQQPRRRRLIYGVPPSQTVTLNTLSGTLSAVSLTVAPGTVAIVANTLTGTMSAVSLTVTPGAVSIGLSTLTRSLSAVSLAVAPGGVTITLSTVTAAGEVIDLLAAADEDQKADEQQRTEDVSVEFLNDCFHVSP